MPADIPAEPWRSFLHDLDRHLKGTTELHCFGGFVVAEYYGLLRATADIDIVHAVGAIGLNRLAAIAGKGSALALQHRVYLDIVTVAVVPEEYERRLIDIYPTRCLEQTKLDVSTPRDSSSRGTAERSTVRFCRSHAMTCPAEVTDGTFRVPFQS